MGEPARSDKKTCYFCGDRDATGLAASWSGKLLFPVCGPCNDYAKQLAAEDAEDDAAIRIRR
tara:strand:- start:513 stop:698 length:186 start_codon:yes stop_codon:yes gene_type:complete